jgi:DNA-binding CsgD family transcriptional regulator
VRTHATLLARVLDQLKLPVFVFEGGRQIYVNDAATDLAGRLRAHDRIELRVLLVDHIAAIEGATRGPARPPAATVSLLTSQSGEPFYLHVWPIARRGARDRLTYAVSVRPSGADVPAFARRYRLSARESQVVELVIRGQANRQIAQTLGIGVETAKKHLSRIFDKVGADSRAQLMAKLG